MKNEFASHKVNGYGILCADSRLDGRKDFSSFHNGNFKILLIIKASSLFCFDNVRLGGKTGKGKAHVVRKSFFTYCL